MALIRTCAMMPAHDYYVRTDERYRDARRLIETFTAGVRVAARTTVVTIPVVVHVLHHTDEQNISDAQIASQIAALNRDYRLANADRATLPPAWKALATDALIEFALATVDPDGAPTTGITRTRTASPAFAGDPGQLDQTIKFAPTGHAAWPRDAYLNIWVCELAGGLLGYAQFPGGGAATDGVVIWHRAFGTEGTAAAPFDLGRTATHEVGHWLNLLHIWGDDGNGCTRSDAVADTPNQAGANTGKPVHPHPTCGNAGDMFMNYMDYVDDDTMVLFTRGQVDRMNATLAGPRAAITRSPALTAPSPLHVLTPSRVGGRAQVFDGVGWVDP